MLPPNQIRTRLRLLQTVHPLFLVPEVLPTVAAAENSQEDEAPLDSVGHLSVITLLCNDFKLNNIRLNRLDVDEFADDKIFQVALQNLLGALENVIDARIREDFEPGGGESYVSEFMDSTLVLFPRLNALRGFLESQRAAEPSNDPVTDEDNTFLYNAGSTQIEPRLPPSMMRAACYIDFPRNFQIIASYQIIAEDFHTAFIRLENSIASRSTAAQMANCTLKEKQVLEDTQEFALAYTSLFSQMAKKTRCDSPHQAKLHLSGFLRDQMTMNIRSCRDEEWQPVHFSTSLHGRPEGAIPIDCMCSWVPPSCQAPEHEMLRVGFDKDDMWIHAAEESASLGMNTHFEREKYKSLDSLIGQQLQFNPKYRKLVGTLLAGSFFRLGNSPWIEQKLERDKVFVPPVGDDTRISQWYPRIDCTLAPNSASIPRSEHIAALGVLILELEANCKAEWSEDDSDYETGVTSNQVRLARILDAKDWEPLVTDNYRDVAKTCLNFESLVEESNHQAMSLDSAQLAITYKMILEPLWRYMRCKSGFSSLDFVFQGLFDSETRIESIKGISCATTANCTFFDDEEGGNTEEQRASGQNFMNNLKPFFDRVEDLRKQAENMNLTNCRRTRRIRIAVLDSGINDKNPWVRRAIKDKRINCAKSKDFVHNSPGTWTSDSCGHGTFVTELLLKTAPSAELYIGKICSEKEIKDESMLGIANAIHWAFEECEADIISISFGFQEEDEKIDVALDKASDAGALIFAAASNNGAFYQRARPARHYGVICVHASDGKGNKGGMNPTELKNTDNFSTLGVAVPFLQHPETVWKSGTSFATPIAAGFAADVLEFANHKCQLKPRHRQLLGQKRGMQAIFLKMAEKRDGYDVIHPRRLWNDWGATGNRKAEREAVAIIEETMEQI